MAHESSYVSPGKSLDCSLGIVVFRLSPFESMQKITPITAPFPHGESCTGSGQKRSALEAQSSSPKAKRTKPSSNLSPKAHPHTSPVPIVLKPFPVKEGDFVKPGSALPRFQRPEEVGFMSLNQARKPAWDKSLLNVFVPVNPKAVRLDLSVGFDKYKEKEPRPEEGISPLLTWLSYRRGAINRERQRRRSEEQTRRGASVVGGLTVTAGSSQEKVTGSAAATGSSKAEPRKCVRMCMCLNWCARVHVCAHVCVCACMRACVHARMCERVCAV